MNVRIMSLTFSLGLGMMACASPGASPFDDSVEPRTVHVEVDNQNFYDATVYVITGAGERRLGIVPGKTEKTFVTRLAGLGDVRLRVRMLAGGSFTTERMTASPGEILVLIILANFGEGDQR